MEHATTLNLPTVAARNNARADLAEAVAAFLDAGGSVDQLEGFEPKPRPARSEPLAPAPIKRQRTDEPVLISSRGNIVTKNRAHAERAYRRREELANRLRPHADMGCMACAAMFGVSHTLVRSVAKQFGITLARVR